MRVSIFGLGYVGAVSAGCIADNGHMVIGVDPFQTKVDLINQGTSPIIEEAIGDIISRTVEQGHLKATTSAAEAVMNTDISLICVGTPSQLNGSLDLKYVRRVCEDIGEILKTKPEFHVVVCRSTILPGSMQSVVIPTLEMASGKTVGVDFGVCNNPEFLRESTAVYDFYNPPKTVVGETDERSGDLLMKLYDDLPGPKIRTTVETAEMVKYTDNVWHAVKVSFANEIGSICKSLEIDSHDVMNIFKQDTKLNISSYYMRPGFSFGGSCLPKDVRALTYKGRSQDLELPLLNSILSSNENHTERGVNLIKSAGSKKVGILGFSFKSGTDDLRESPLVDVIEHLIGKGFDLKLYDKNVNLARLVGANKDFILNTIPHISSLMVNTIEEIINHSDVIVIGNGSEEFKNILELKRTDQTVIDLVRICDSKTDSEIGYGGICW
ncbi:MAG: nucleotide sugar dehydrogenase [Cyanobacteria bacterium P01_E01_bin.34]